ncbi:DUF5131 family protein [Nocardia goodfellowii]
MTGIEWTQTTWNPVTGCDRVSAGCDHCYALALAKRLKAMGTAKYQRDGNPVTSGPGFAVTTHPAALATPARWRTPRLVFVNSMSDLFHAHVDTAFIGQVFEVIADTPQHTYQVLTKRPLRARRLADAGLVFPPNLWLGVSVEDQKNAENRIRPLLGIPARVRFLSCEPLLGPLDLSPDLRSGGVDWVIVGGESGPGARPVRADWIRRIRDDCATASVPFFFKQWGGRTPKANGRTLDGQIWSQMPEPADHAEHGPPRS